uniref:C2h2-type zn-finger protein n=2 Tax=Lutzomyia longipalpis TaxID=7200 RepID=A0A1B0CVD1_LUTLO
MDVVGGVVPEYNLDKLCRLCLKEDEDVRSIFSDENGQTFTEIIMACAEIQIQENDGMPNQMCGMCKVQVQSAYAFRKRTEENDASLRMYMVHKFPERFKASEIHQNALETNSILDLKPDQEFQNVEFTLSIEPDVSFGVDMDDGVAGEEVIEYLETDEDLKPQFDKESEEKSQEEGSTVMVCHVCNEEYADVGELKGHIESTHTRHKVKQCRACRTQFRMKTQAKRLTTEQEEQVEEESKADKEACSQCEKKFPNVEALKAHLQTHKKQKRGRPSLKDIEVRNQLSNLKDEEEKQNKVYQMIQEYSPEGVVALCRICDVTFSKICQLRNHLNKHKCLDSFADVNLTTKCYLFDNTKIMPDMETNESLINYVMNEICMGNSTRFYQITNNNGHEFELSDSDSSESGTEDFLSGDRRHHQCSACQQVFDRLYKILAHMRLDHIESDFTAKCPQCTRVFPNDALLAKHTRLQCQNKEKMYFCRICKIKFMWENSHEKHHQNFHANRTLVAKGRRDKIAKGKPREKSFPCSICSKAFYRQEHLDRHVKIHMPSEKKFECTVCVRPYKCTYCDRAFTQSNDLTLHIRRHTGDKPYVCGICGDRFIQGTALAAHRRMQGHYEEVNQPTPFSSISVNNPNRFTNANRVNRIGIPPATQPEQQQQQQPQPTTLIISPSTQVTTLANIKTEKVQNEAIVIPVNALTQSTQNRASSPLNPTIARIHVNSAGYGANGQIFSSFEVTSLLSMPHYQMQQQTTDTQQQQQQPNQQGYN